MDKNIINSNIINFALIENKNNNKSVKESPINLDEIIKMRKKELYIRVEKIIK